MFRSGSVNRPAFDNGNDFLQTWTKTFAIFFFDFKRYKKISQDSLLFWSFYCFFQSEVKLPREGKNKSEKQRGNPS